MVALPPPYQAPPHAPLTGSLLLRCDLEFYFLEKTEHMRPKPPPVFSFHFFNLHITCTSPEHPQKESGPPLVFQLWIKALPLRHAHSARMNGAGILHQLLPFPPIILLSSPLLSSFCSCPKIWKHFAHFSLEIQVTDSILLIHSAK